MTIVRALQTQQTNAQSLLPLIGEVREVRCMVMALVLGSPGTESEAIKTLKIENDRLRQQSEVSVLLGCVR